MGIVKSCANHGYLYHFFRKSVTIIIEPVHFSRHPRISFSYYNCSTICVRAFTTEVKLSHEKLWRSRVCSWDLTPRTRPSTLRSQWFRQPSSMLPMCKLKIIFQPTRAFVDCETEIIVIIVTSIYTTITFQYNLITLIAIIEHNDIILPFPCQWKLELVPRPAWKT